MSNRAAESAARVRAQLAKAGGATKGRGRGYGSVARAEAVAHARGRIAAGASLHAVAGELGVSAVTLGRWLEGPIAVGFARVAVAPEPSVAAMFRLVSPTGWRVEGVDLASLRGCARSLDPAAREAAARLAALVGAAGSEEVDDDRIYAGGSPLVRCR